MIESITDRLCCKNWSITDRSYESISDSFAIFAIFFKNVAISLIIIPQMVIHYNYPILNLVNL